MWGWLPFRNQARRRRSPFNNLGPEGLTCGQVTEHLFVGGELGPNDWHALRHAGITMVINLQQEQQDVFTAEEQVDGYLWLPAPDGLAPTLGQLALGVDFIQGAVDGRRKVLVHCKAGQGRAPLLCACYLISRGMAFMDALIQVRQARPQTMLTPEQNVRLREFASAFAQRVDPVPTALPSRKAAPNGAAPVGPATEAGKSMATNGAAVPVETPAVPKPQPGPKRSPA